MMVDIEGGSFAVERNEIALIGVVDQHKFSCLFFSSVNASLKEKRNQTHVGERKKR